MQLPDLNAMLMRYQFGGAARIEIYETIAQLMENRVLLIDILRTLYRIKSEDGRKPNQPVAYVLAHCIESVSAGKALSGALADFIPSQEASLLAAGEQSGQISQAFETAIRLIVAKKRIVAAVANAATYPLFLSGLTGYLLNMVASDLVPKLSKMADPKHWEGAAYLLYLIATAVTDYSKFILAVLFIGIIAVGVSMPMLCGRWRIYLDRFPPWSLYRTIHGATFLLNIAILLRAGVKLQEVLVLLSEGTAPWLTERIEGALYGTRRGANLGEALYNAGHEFPDRQAIQMIALLANTDGFESALSRFGDRWLEESIKKVEAFGKTFLSLGVAAVGIIMILVVSGTSGIQDAIQASVQ